jgi:hypothetical protein
MLKERFVKRKSVSDKWIIDLILSNIRMILITQSVKLSQANRVLRLFNLKVGLSANKKTKKS